MSQKRSDKNRRRKSRKEGARHLHVVPPSAPTYDDGLPHVEAQPESDPLPDLMGDVERALQGSPLDLLTLVSALLSVTDERTHDPFEPQPPERPTLELLVESFVEVDLLATTAILHALSALVADEVTRTRIERELRRRTHPMPDWLVRLDQVEVHRTVEMSHVLGDGDDIMIGARLGDHEFTALVYIDHNMGTAVKDAFVIDESITRVLDETVTQVADADTTVTDVDPAEARVKVTEAIHVGGMTVPRFESDTWPMCRFLVEWLARLLPVGGIGYVVPEWSDDETGALARDFFGSTHAARFGGDSDYRALVENLIWFGSGYSSGDPLRWSPVNVEILLVDWFPRKVMADVAYLAKMPELLRAFVQYCHGRAGIRSELTEEVLASIDAYEPTYLQAIRGSRPQGAEAVASMMFDLQVNAVEEDGYDHEEPLEEYLLRLMDREVGGRSVLMNLDTDPLPDEPFDWAGIPEDIEDRVREVLELCDAGSRALFGVEARTACRRLLGRIAVADPRIFRRAAAARPAAAAVVWLVGTANNLVGAHRGAGVQAKTLVEWFEVKSGPNARATTFMAALGLGRQEQDEKALGSPDYLTGERRRAMTERRDKCLAGFDF